MKIKPLNLKLILVIINDDEDLFKKKTFLQVIFVKEKYICVFSCTLCTTLPYGVNAKKNEIENENVKKILSAKNICLTHVHQPRTGLCHERMLIIMMM